MNLSRRIGLKIRAWTGPVVLIACGCAELAAQDAPDNPPHGVDFYEADWWKTAGNPPCDRGLMVYNFGPDLNYPDDPHRWIKYLGVFWRGDFFAWGIEWGSAGNPGLPIDFGWYNTPGSGSDAASTPQLEGYAPHSALAGRIAMLSLRNPCDLLSAVSLLGSDPLSEIPAGTTPASTCPVP